MYIFVGRKYTMQIRPNNFEIRMLFDIHIHILYINRDQVTMYLYALRIKLRKYIYYNKEIKTIHDLYDLILKDLINPQLNCNIYNLTHTHIQTRICSHSIYQPLQYDATHSNPFNYIMCGDTQNLLTQTNPLFLIECYLLVLQ